MLLKLKVVIKENFVYLCCGQTMRNMLKTLKEISINVLIQNFLKKQLVLFFRIQLFIKKTPYLLLAMTICEVLKFDFCPTLFKAESQTFWFEDQILFILCFDEKKTGFKTFILKESQEKTNHKMRSLEDFFRFKYVLNFNSKQIF